METATGERAAFCAWLDQWWYLTSEWLHDPYPLDDSIGSQQFRPPNKWDDLAHQGAILPDQWTGIDLSPLKDLLFAMIAYGDPAPMHGKTKSLDDIHDIASRAWRAKTRFDHVRQQRLREQPPVETSYNMAGLKAIIAVEDNATVNRYLKAAKLPVAEGRGKRQSYSRDQAISFARQVIAHPTVKRHAVAAQKWMDDSKIR